MATKLTLFPEKKLLVSGQPTIGPPKTRRLKKRGPRHWLDVQTSAPGWSLLPPQKTPKRPRFQVTEGMFNQILYTYFDGKIYYTHFQYVDMLLIFSLGRFDVDGLEEKTQIPTNVSGNYRETPPQSKYSK